MASLEQGTYTRPIPDQAPRKREGGRDLVRLTVKGKAVWCRVCPGNPDRCQVPTGTWVVVYRDALGRKRRRQAYRDRAASERLLADVVRRVERERAGLIEPGAEDATAPLEQLVGEWLAVVAAEGASAGCVRDLGQRVRAVLEACRFRQFADLSSDPVRLYLARRRKAGLAAQTSNHYTAAVRQFVAWLARRLRSAVDPLADLRRIPVDDDLRHVRRALDADTFARFLDGVRSSERIAFRFAGPERWALYLTAAYSGLRASELASLTPESFWFGSPPTVTVEAAYAKSGRRDEIPLPDAVAAALRPWLAARPPGSRCWPGGWAHGHNGAKLLKGDLIACGVPYRDADDRVFDFHALRSQFGTSLARAGVPLAVAQRLLRHSTPVLTAKHYTRLELHDLAGAANRLPAPTAEEKKRRLA